jgi:hypothetical protein
MPGFKICWKRRPLHQKMRSSNYRINNDSKKWITFPITLGTHSMIQIVQLLGLSDKWNRWPMMEESICSHSRELINLIHISRMQLLLEQIWHLFRLVSIMWESTTIIGRHREVLHFILVAEWSNRYVEANLLKIMSLRSLNSRKLRKMLFEIEQKLRWPRTWSRTVSPNSEKN